MKKMKDLRQTLVQYIGYLAAFVFLGALIIFTLFPVIYAVLGAFKTNFELVSGAGFWPKEWQWQNITYTLERMNFMRYAMNSFFLCVMCTVLSMILSSLGGYCLGRYVFPGSNLLMGVNYSLMFISLGSVVLFPIYNLMDDLGLTSTLIGLALVLTGGQSSNIVLVRGFVKNLPKELDESAMIDGATPFQIYCRIILPLLRPIMATVGVFTFRNVWNDYLTSMVFTIGQKDLKTLTVATVGLRYSANAAAEWHIMCAGVVISMIPILIVYILANKQLISGLTAGAVKG